MDTRRVMVTTILAVIALMVWTTYAMNRKAEANGELLALLVYGQASIPPWRPVIPVPAIVDVLKDGQLSLCMQARDVLTAQIANVESKPVGYYLTVSDPSSPNGQTRMGIGGERCSRCSRCSYKRAAI